VSGPVGRRGSGVAGQRAELPLAATRASARIRSACREGLCNGAIAVGRSKCGKACPEMPARLPLAGVTSPPSCLRRASPRLPADDRGALSPKDPVRLRQLLEPSLLRQREPPLSPWPGSFGSDSGVCTSAGKREKSKKTRSDSALLLLESASLLVALFCFLPQAFFYSCNLLLPKQGLFSFIHPLHRAASIPGLFLLFAVPPFDCRGGVGQLSKDGGMSSGRGSRPEPTARGGNGSAEISQIKIKTSITWKRG